MSTQQPPSTNPSSNPTTAPPESTIPTTTASSSPNTTLSDLYTLGLQTRTSVLGPEHVNRSLASANAFTLPMQETITEWAWGATWNRPGLDRKQRSLLNLGILIALGRQHELAMHVRGAIRNGLSELEIREAVMHALVYVGAPAAMEGMRTVDTMLGEMERNGEIVRETK
ncbi:AhpD-like protein [Aspergillus karnatakaensis]|uniref:AhpD-like protein n=1 Tax=Aspergillus karnatakaensis TaxID=1810916 RepID=UPI003CCD53FB